MAFNSENDIKRALESAPVPDELSPENMKKKLDAEAAAKKRKGIKKSLTRIGAGAAACAVICGFGVYYARSGDDFDKTASEVTSDSDTKESNIQESSVKNISDYSQLYEMLEESYEKYSENNSVYDEGAEVLEAVEGDAVAEDSQSDVSYASNSDSSVEYSDTYNQENDVLEADITKTDGKYIYYLCDKYSDDGSYSQYINIAEIDDGSFTDAVSLYLTDDFYSGDALSSDVSVTLHDMYIYNDMLLVMGEVSIYHEPIYAKNYDGYDVCTEYGYFEDYVCVNAYTTGISPELVDSYCQDGYYNDVRITSDGYMYLITEDSSKEFNYIANEESTAEYIPCYMADGEEYMIPPENIIISDDELGECSSISYTVIGGLDLNTSGDIGEINVLATTGKDYYYENIYCNSSNLYTASGYDETVITRFSLESGTVTAAATGTVKGYVNDQFSLSEYDGYLRVATTYENWNESILDDIYSYERTSIDNYVYVLDMGLNIVGSINEFSTDETIKSVNFNEEMAYVVTYEQTDPLFAIDLSNPEQPVILDEFKLLGYSTYMQEWDENGLLLGFGTYADENGIEDGVKLVMFDNSDPENLNEVGTYVINSDDDDIYIYSEGTWERKALLIAPEKNLIGIPIMEYNYSDDAYFYTTRYMFFSYENGEFIYLNEISKTVSDYDSVTDYTKALYIGDYVYVLSAEQFVSLDIATLTQQQSVDF